MYLNTREGSGQIPTTLQPRNLTPGSGYAVGPAPSAVEGFGQPISPTPPAAPVFRFECPAGCHPVAAEECRRVLRRAIVDAMGLCSIAAGRLEASPRSTKTRNIFRSLFGHDPSRPVPWAGGKESGAIVAHRLRKVAEAFHGRVPHIRCSTKAGCNAFVQPRAAPSAANPLPRNTIFLCAPFWSAAIPGTVPRFWRAAVLLHEMLHLLFWEFFGHQKNLPRPGDPEERRRDNSHCYEAFALQVAGHSADPKDEAACKKRDA